MSMPLLQSKRYVPPPRPHLVARPSMTAKLVAGSLLPFPLLAAPAGFGKTTAVSEWLAQTTANVLDCSIWSPQLLRCLGAGLSCGMITRTGQLSIG